MAEGQIVIHPPEDGETMTHYFQRYTPEQRDCIYEDKIMWKKFSEVLRNTAWAIEKEHESFQVELENLWKILASLGNFRRLLHFIDMLEIVRTDLLDALDDYEKSFATYTKFFGAGIVLCSVSDIAGMIGDLWSEHNWALDLSSWSGYVNVGLSLAKFKLLSDEFKCLKKKLKRDQNFLRSIQRWYQGSSELEDKLKKIFAFDDTNRIVKEFEDATEEQLDPEEILLMLLKNIKDLKMEQIYFFLKSPRKRIHDLIVSLIARSTGINSNIGKLLDNREKESDKNNASHDFENDSRTSKSSVCTNDSDITKSSSDREEESDIDKSASDHVDGRDIDKTAEYKSLLFYAQVLEAIAPRKPPLFIKNQWDKRIRAGFGIVLNVFSICDSVSCIKRIKDQEIEIKVLRRQLNKELSTLRRIADLIRLKSDGLFL